MELLNQSKREREGERECGGRTRLPGEKNEKSAAVKKGGTLSE